MLINEEFLKLNDHVRQQMSNENNGNAEYCFEDGIVTDYAGSNAFNSIRKKQTFEKEDTQMDTFKMQSHLQSEFDQQASPKIENLFNNNISN